ncbi:hypothetical protein PITC_041210 [Penicillium italicum]|uniref:Uncharacterized protein n=1 Tax=Penicillium italicum TaxID=40296 RepID=A0A0A2LP74_PENIT|nr:hypothetical protein PITC_041210 [Penicillium italicum]
MFCNYNVGIESNMSGLGLRANVKGRSHQSQAFLSRQDFPCFLRAPASRPSTFQPFYFPGHGVLS